MHFVEGLTDGDTPRCESKRAVVAVTRKIARAMALSIGFFGTYSVYEQERFAGNRVEGSQLGWWCAHDTGAAVEGRGRAHVRDLHAPGW
ncbi:hypothetical protein [Ectopseudomonas hydrolytica]|jgi:hypothetical protein|uniref:hypothetical protein n=1 Tax=Ectopseudomonas hydrolytica TaxID=2493633 RepID=UPI0020B67448|nr:hypothetical protein [Pseudomonas hydrolytica]UTH32811.1 hypothetical protein NLY38_05720 [Pseudomonas hydrolytica]